MPKYAKKNILKVFQVWLQMPPNDTKWLEMAPNASKSVKQLNKNAKRSHTVSTSFVISEKELNIMVLNIMTHDYV